MWKFDIIFSIFIGLKNQFIEDWENWFWKKKKKIDFKKLEGEGDQYIFILIIYLINTHVSTLYSECRVTVY